MTSMQNDIVPETDPVIHFSDADLKAAMLRVLRMTAAFAVIGFGILFFVTGWRNAAMFLAGAVVSGTGLYEWQQLINVVNAKLDNQKTPKSTGFVLSMFFLRLGFAALVIYGSLRCFHGSLYALVGGLGLGVITLLIEAVRQLRS